jgi:hypothetical protein
MPRSNNDAAKAGPSISPLKNERSNAKKNQIADVVQERFDNRLF